MVFDCANAFPQGEGLAGWVSPAGTLLLGLEIRVTSLLVEPAFVGSSWAFVIMLT